MRLFDVYVRFHNSRIAIAPTSVRARVIVCVVVGGQGYCMCLTGGFPRRLCEVCLRVNTFVHIDTSSIVLKY